MKRNFLRVFLSLFVYFFIFQVSITIASSKDVCSVYFSGIGCPHCAETDPVVLDKIFDTHDNLVVIDYEVYHSRVNAPLMRKYDKSYSTGLGIPIMIFDDDNIMVGDKDVLSEFSKNIDKKNKNNCLLPDGTSRKISEIDFDSLEGEPRIFAKNRVLVRKNKGINSDKIRELLFVNNNDIVKVLSDIPYKKLDNNSVDISGGEIKFDNVVQLNGWILYWNGNSVNKDENKVDGIINSSNKSKNNNIDENNDFAFMKIVSLALVDAINPCAFAVLLLMLTAILAYNPRDKKNLILSGLVFIASIFLMYLFYGLVIIKFMILVQAITSVRVFVYKIFGILAIILGVLNIKDFISYKPGSLGTEMPLFMRPKVKVMINKITSPIGAFSIGIFVTLFLLPCTIGPYVIGCGLLSVQGLMKSLPLLILYNFIFVLPMFFILIFVVIGFRKVDDISAWKEKNINKLHLSAGVVMLLLGVAMLLGWV